MCTNTMSSTNLNVKDPPSDICGSLKCRKETQQAHAMCDHCAGTGTECNEDKHAEIPVPVRCMRTRKKTQTPVRKNCVDSYAPSITVQFALWKRTLSRAPEFANHGSGALFQQHPIADVFLPPLACHFGASLESPFLHLLRLADISS